MKIFVTGATGFIGSNFVQMALSDNHEVIGLKRHKNSLPRIRLLKEPIWNEKSLDQLVENDFDGVDVFVHLAAHSMTPPYDTLENCMYWNVIAPLKAFNVALKAGVKKFVVTGSCFEYGDTGMEYNFIPINVDLKPNNTYAASKAAASVCFYQFCREFNLNLFYNRLFHVYGHGEDKSRLWPSLKEAALNGSDFKMTLGQQLRDFIHVDLVCKELLNQCKEKLTTEIIYRNLGTGNPQSILDFSKFWWNTWEAKGRLLVGEIPYRNNEIMSYVPKVETVIYHGN